MLLTDDDWWSRWLPRLYELLGRQPGHHARARVDLFDNRDLMTFLFPPISSGTNVLTWRSPEYGEMAREGNAQNGRPSATESGGPDTERGAVWEPVLRQVAEALWALASSGTDGADPYLRLRAKAEIIGPWIEALRYLLGEGAPALPGCLVA